MKRTTTVRRITAAAAAAAVVTLGAAACTNDDSGSQETTTTEAAEDQSTTDAVQSTVTSLTEQAGNAVQDAINSAVGAAPVSFDANSAELGTLQNATLTAVAAALETNEDKLEIKAYAMDEDSSAADDLAQERGEAVKSKLVEEGISEDRLDVSSEGNPDDSDVDPNRVDFEVTSE
ncbi:hypothetical protein DW322_18425 [Rhodococcus rhodnii]|uniref:OmpA-like domain-containing protein n=2 Tax=Rhodococcus rhodnii TaxID=38312 RepID=R7WLG3_9NOCA|nr:OmpA family protein [Rhodococcus rhodnii]EOM76147.1 hypothetical protein Rrhod_2513 [Rhodococcus rhodnii LMG 5362]TXG91797.1 hypothetical protein DW322_18425 [Rhodococcus rhodnii]